MDSSNSAGAPDPDESYESKSDNTNLSDHAKLLHDFLTKNGCDKIETPDPDKSYESKSVNTNLSDPAKLLHDYFLAKDGCDEIETPIILDALFNTISPFGIDTEEYHKILDKILIFDSTTNELNCKKILQIIEGIKTLKEKERLQLLSKKGAEEFPKLQIAFKKASERYSKLQSEIEEFKYKKLPQIVNEMKTLQEKVSFSEALVFKPHEIIQQCINWSNERVVILKQMEHFKYTIDYVISHTNNAQTLPKNGSKLGKTEFKHKIETTSIENVNLENLPENGSITATLVFRHKKETTGIKNVNLEKACKESEKSICRSEHNTPFCKNCGWRTSWLKNFRKRGVYIKEADNSACKHIWCNNVNTD